MEQCITVAIIVQRKCSNDSKNLFDKKGKKILRYRNFVSSFFIIVATGLLNIAVLSESTKKSVYEVNKYLRMA